MTLKNWQRKPGFQLFLHHKRLIFPKGPDYINSVKKMQLFDLLEAVKHSNGEDGHGPNCTIWGNKPSSDPLQAFFK